MRWLSRARLLAGLALLAVLVSASLVQAQAQKFKDVSFKSYDGVELKGALYPRGGNSKRDGVVMLLHNFDLKKGGSSQQTGWTDLAERLQEEGFNVLMFDFRGFGASTNVTSDFWNYKDNQLIKGSVKKPSTISFNHFINSAYLVNLVHDVAAAKAYLDRRNDAKELNSSSVVVIGAGSGAAIGAAWLANECHRKRDTNVPPMFRPNLVNQPEVSDIACAVWLTMNPSLGTRSVRNQLPGWIREAGKRNKVPMAFVYGKQDTAAAREAQGLVTQIRPDTPAGKKQFPNTGTYAVPGTKLAGNELLKTDLVRGPKAWLIKDYLEPVFQERGSKEQKDRRSEQSQYFYVLPNGRMTISKKAGQEAPAVDLGALGLR
jgi:hypothetical protein